MREVSGCQSTSAQRNADAQTYFWRLMRSESREYPTRARAESGIEGSLAGKRTRDW
jgi:hypothetical protein